MKNARGSPPSPVEQALDVSTGHEWVYPSTRRQIECPGRAGPGAGAPTAEGEAAPAPYLAHLHHEQDLSAATCRNSLSDLRQFAAWCEHSWAEGQDELRPFAPMAISTPTLATYRSYLQTVVGLQPATINRHLVSLKRYLAWAVDTGLLARDPSRVVKLIPRTPQPPRHLSDREEEALMAAVSPHGSLRDRTLLVVALHTGLRAEELCRLKPEHVHLGRRSGHVSVYGKRNKYREVPLNSTPRDALSAYLKTLPHEAAFLFPSRKQERSGVVVNPIGERERASRASRGPVGRHTRCLLNLVVVVSLGSRRPRMAHQVGPHTWRLSVLAHLHGHIGRLTLATGATGD